MSQQNRNTTLNSNICPFIRLLGNPRVLSNIQISYQPQGQLIQYYSKWKFQSTIGTHKGEKSPSIHKKKSARMLALYTPPWPYCWGNLIFSA